MLTRVFLLRIAGPTLFVSLLFLGSCLTASLYLYHRQSASLRHLDENLQGQRASSELLQAFDDLAALPPNRRKEAEALEKKAREVLGRARRALRGPEALRLINRIEERTNEYSRIRAGADDGPGAKPAAGASPDESARDHRAELGPRELALLHGAIVPACRALERFSGERVAESEKALHGAVTWTAWGLVGVGVIGALAGLVLGHGVARGLVRAVLRAESLAEVGQVAAGMAHELRNPLTAIKMLVQTNREEAAAAGAPIEDWRVIEQEILRMEARLNVFIDFARPPRPEWRKINLVSVVDETLALIGGRTRKQRVQLKFERPAAPVEVEADGEQIRQLLVNLALNALDVMPRGGALEIELRPPRDGHAELSVLDTGPGIPANHLLRLYEPFFTSKETGLGLGLAVSKRIALDHGGTLRAANRPEGGARFTVRLPTEKRPSAWPSWPPRGTDSALGP